MLKIILSFARTRFKQNNMEEKINFQELKGRGLDALILKPSSGQMSSIVAGDEVILNTKSGVYFGLNPVGSWIWNLMKEGISVQDIKEKALEKYQVSPEDFERDLIEILQSLADGGLLEIQLPV